ncbi:MAG: hypothetical protein Q4A08_01350 [Bacteroidales bacterium]|nr:hypothetical protein [Bacteroidales bacterium]
MKKNYITPDIKAMNVVLPESMLAGSLFGEIDGSTDEQGVKDFENFDTFEDFNNIEEVLSFEW